MKKLAKIITVFVLIMAIMVPVFASAEGSSRVRYVNTSTEQKLNMRSSCDYNGRGGVITAIPYGAPVTFIKLVSGGHWAMIEFEGRVGYVVNQCLSKTPVGLGFVNA